MMRFKIDFQIPVPDQNAYFVIKFHSVGNHKIILKQDHLSSCLHGEEHEQISVYKRLLTCENAGSSFFYSSCFCFLYTMPYTIINVLFLHSSSNLIPDRTKGYCLDSKFVFPMGFQGFLVICYLQNCYRKLPIQFLLCIHFHIFQFIDIIVVVVVDAVIIIIMII